MTVKYSQLTLAENFSAEIFCECQELLVSDKPTFFTLLEEHLNLNEFISVEFYCAFHLSIGRKIDYPLKGFLSALILQKTLTIPTDFLLIILLSLYHEFSVFCGFTKTPDAPLFTWFKQTFTPYLELIFSRIVYYTELICQAIDSTLASIITFDTSGIDLYVKENNPKYLNTLIKQLKTYYKDNPNVNPYKMAYGLIPSQAASTSGTNKCT